MSLIFLRNRATEEKDEELLKRFRESGGIEVLGQLYERYMHLVYGVCLKYLEDRDTAKDEVMNIFEKLVTAVPGQEIVSFKTWLYVVTKNHCLMLLRSRKSEVAHMALMLDDPTFFMEKETEMHPFRNVEAMDEKMDEGKDKKMDTGRLEECIEKLKEEQKQCIQLFYYEGLGYKEICRRLGMEEGKVKSYIQNGKRNLKICMELGARSMG